MKNPPRFLFAFLMALALLFWIAPARANAAPPPPAAPVATAPVEAPAPAPAAPAAPAPHARREEEDPAAATAAKRPSFIARLLGGGNAPDPLALANQTITDLRAQLTEAQSALTTARAELTAARADLTEAGDYIRSMATGTLNPVATPPPANPVAAAAVEAVTAHQTQAIRRIGIPVAHLETPAAPAAAAAAPADPAAAAAAAEIDKNNQLKAIWASRGYQFPGTSN